VVNTPERICHERNKTLQIFADRVFGPHVIRNQISDLKRGLQRLEQQGFRYVHILDRAEDNEIRRIPLLKNKKPETGPFDIIVDLHGCADELRLLMMRAGWEQFSLLDQDEPWACECRSHPSGRRSVFLCDLVDWGPHVLDTLRILRNMVTVGPHFALQETTTWNACGGIRRRAIVGTWKCSEVSRPASQFHERHAVSGERPLRRECVVGKIDRQGRRGYGRQTAL